MGGEKQKEGTGSREIDLERGLRTLDVPIAVSLPLSFKGGEVAPAVPEVQRHLGYVYSLVYTRHLNRFRIRFNLNRIRVNALVQFGNWVM